MTHFILFLIAACSALAQIQITELHPTPAGGEPEWIECVNVSERTVRLNDWYVCDNRSCVRLGTLSLVAGGYLVLTRDVSALREQRWLGPNVTVVEIALPSLNNSTDQVEIRGADSSIVDTMSYDMRRYVRGRSIERGGTIISGSVVFGNSWGTCLSRDSTTCGDENSTIILNRDLRVSRVVVLDSAIRVDVVNYGVADMPSTKLDVTWGPMHYRTMAPALSASKEWGLEIAIAGLQQRGVVDDDKIMAVVSAGDDRSENDTVIVALRLPPAPTSVLINEVMSDPLSSSCDYVEIWNGSADTLDLDGWIIEDASGINHVSVGTVLVAPNMYGVIAADTSIRAMADVHTWCVSKPTLSLNISSDVVVLRNPSGFLVDKVAVDQKYHHPRAPSTKGVSLEKRRPQLVGSSAPSWTSCADRSGGTPGRENSVAADKPAVGVMTAVPSPFSSDPGSSRGPTVITWRQPFEQAVARVRIFRPDGGFVADLLNAVFIAREGGVAWNGIDSNGLRVWPGPYVVVLECVDASSSSVYTDRCLVIVGE